MRDLLVGGLVIILLAVVPGLFLWWPKRHDPVSRSELGVALMTGALIAVAVLGIQTSIDSKARKRDASRQAADARQNFELTLALQPDLSGIRLDGEDLRGIHFYGKIMRRATLNRAIMDEVILSRAQLPEASLQRTILNGAVMDGVDLRAAHLENALLIGAVLTDAGMRGSYLNGAHLESADLSRAVLRFAILRNSHLEGTSFSGADLRSADLGGATWDASTGLAGALYDQFTRWPDGIKQPRCRRPPCFANDPPQ